MLAGEHPAQASQLAGQDALSNEHQHDVAAATREAAALELEPMLPSAQAKAKPRGALPRLWKVPLPSGQQSGTLSLQQLSDPVADPGSMQNNAMARDMLAQKLIRGAWI